MATVIIRRLDESLKARLRIRAAHHGRSMEEEAREILRDSLQAEERPGQPGLATRIRRHIIPLGGVELVLPRREAARRPPKFKA